MSTKQLWIAFTLLLTVSGVSQTQIKDSQTQYPVSYATISFNNGLGLFANDEGIFVFTEKLYPDIDTLYISALGYKDLKVPTNNLPPTLSMETKVDALDEVIINSRIKRKHKEHLIKPYLDDDYYHGWLPTIESEIAVYFNNPDTLEKKITEVHFPITLESRDWKKRKRSNADKKPFSTLFKVNFYQNNNGIPGKQLMTENFVFEVTEKDGDQFSLNVGDDNIYFPENGVFISLQVIGYTDGNGKLLPNKLFKEIKSRDGSSIKIPTNFRPLLPFTDAITENNTYIKRVFINDNQWTLFQKGNFNSTLLQSGLKNYGMGMTYITFKN